MILTELQNFGDYLGFIIDGILNIFNQLANIEFLGTNMLRFSLMIMIIGTGIPILFSLTNFRRFRGTTEKRKVKNDNKSR